MFFGIRERKMLCSALLQAHFDYACNSWYRGLQKKLKDKLQTTQNKVIRYVLNYHCRQHIGFKDFLRIGWMNVKSRVDYLALNLMYNIFNRTAPSYMMSGLKFKCHNHKTRCSDYSYFVPSVKTQGSVIFNYCGIKLWNALPSNIKVCNVKSEYKNKCKGFLMNKMKVDEESEFVM